MEFLQFHQFWFVVLIVLFCFIHSFHVFELLTWRCSRTFCLEFPRFFFCYINSTCFNRFTIFSRQSMTVTIISCKVWTDVINFITCSYIFKYLYKSPIKLHSNKKSSNFVISSTRNEPLIFCIATAADCIVHVVSSFSVVKDLLTLHTDHVLY